MPEIVLLLAECANEAEAKRIARALVRGRFAACVNVYPRIHSVYRWKGAVEEAREAAIIVKTSKAKARTAAEKIAELHSYETPAVILLKAQAAGKAAAWLKENLQNP